MSSYWINKFVHSFSCLFIYLLLSNLLLLLAAACGRRPCVEWLLGNTGITGNERNKLGSSPLHLATQDGHLEVVKLLVRR